MDIKNKIASSLDSVTEDLDNYISKLKSESFFQSSNNFLRLVNDLSREVFLLFDKIVNDELPGTKDLFQGKTGIILQDEKPIIEKLDETRTLLFKLFGDVALDNVSPYVNNIEEIQSLRTKIKIMLEKVTAILKINTISSLEIHTKKLGGKPNDDLLMRQIEINDKLTALDKGLKDYASEKTTVDLAYRIISDFGNHVKTLGGILKQNIDLLNIENRDIDEIRTQLNIATITIDTIMNKLTNGLSNNLFSNKEDEDFNCEGDLKVAEGDLKTIFKELLEKITKSINQIIMLSRMIIIQDAKLPLEMMNELKLNLDKFQFQITKIEQKRIYIKNHPDYFIALNLMNPEEDVTICIGSSPEDFDIGEIRRATYSTIKADTK